MNLSFRRFPETITRVRSEGPYSDDYGRPITPAAVETELKASVQPLSLEDEAFVGGTQLIERLKVYVPASEGDLLAAFDADLADQVIYKGKTYTVEESRTWPKYTRAMLIRSS